MRCTLPCQWDSEIRHYRNGRYYYYYYHSHTLHRLPALADTAILVLPYPTRLYALEFYGTAALAISPSSVTALSRGHVGSASKKSQSCIHQWLIFILSVKQMTFLKA